MGGYGCSWPWPSTEPPQDAADVSSDFVQPPPEVVDEAPADLGPSLDGPVDRVVAEMTTADALDALDSPDADIAVADATSCTAGAPCTQSCLAILQALPSAHSGQYNIDPDGSGPAQPFIVQCDMTTNGGGWTIVFASAGANYDTPTLEYDVPNAQLLTAASDVLLAFRDVQGILTLGRQTASLLLMPTGLRVAAPFTYTDSDVGVMVSIDGSTSPFAATLRWWLLRLRHVILHRQLGRPYVVWTRVHRDGRVWDGRTVLRRFRKLRHGLVCEQQPIDVRSVRCTR